MTCAERERELALYAGGDLCDAAGLERHLDECARCRRYVDGLRALLAELAAGAAPSTPPIAVTVMRRIRARRYGWAAFGATAAAAAVLIAVQIAALSRPVPAISLALRPPAAPVVTAARHAAPAAAVKPRLARRTVPARPSEPVVVKLVTDDPNVVIYWLTD